MADEEFHRWAEAQEGKGIIAGAATKPKHSVFNTQDDNALALVDEAWAMRGAPDPKDPGAYVVDMGRPIGTSGETSIRIIVKPGTTEVITAYPY
ncbi:hypothetical protein [Chelativorans alearense]|uniref:hypothetical protein n=1 Tax=Chelativorans alearense TaxID=2681495 RepID=UPI0013D2337B|nr:hypothetical protein [Chelativorans alearense]